MSCIMLLAHSSLLIVVPFSVFLSWVEPGDEFVNEEPVEYAYEDQVFVNSELCRQDDHTLEITSIFAC